MRLFHYVGPRRIADRVRPEFVGVPIRSPDDLRAWVRNTGQDTSCIATFVVDADGVLLVADRHSEHVVCAGGKPVRAAGEMGCCIAETIEVVYVSNQSTGYCPQPECWPAVADALARAGLDVPDGFTLACEFRRCLDCASLCLLEDEAYECAVCGSELPLAYNVQ